MNLRKRLLITLILLTFLFPINIYAYSSKVILGGDNIGISVKTKEVLVIGFYKVNDKYIASEAGFAIGDKIIKINNIDISSIDELVKEINKSESENIEVTIIRNDEKKTIILPLIKEKNILKTGLYIKDQITGIGTLTYIDPETKIYGSLGHEIVDNKTGKIIDIISGNIFKSDITGTIKSTVTKTGEKKAKFSQDEIKGSLEKNTSKGIYGKYTEIIDESKLIEVGEKEEVKLGPAKIYTVLSDNIIKSYDINIIKINKNTESKNILFEITDKELINDTNGVIKGMSGSPIVQNKKIVGAVTHAIINDNTKGYGIFITTMLEEWERKSNLKWTPNSSQEKNKT